MLKYIVYFKEAKLGWLYINKQGNYKYIACKKNIEKVEKEENVSITADFKKSRSWGPAISFFDSQAEKCTNKDYYFIKDNSVTL